MVGMYNESGDRSRVGEEKEEEKEEDRFTRYRKRQLKAGMVRVTGYVHREDRQKALEYLERLRKAAGSVA